MVRSPASVVVGNKDVIAATMATLAECPDRTLLGEDVIWCGAPEEGLLSSHRLLSTATHTHPGLYGVPTGKKLHYRIIADCHAKNNQIDDEWLVRDQGAIVRQLGLDPMPVISSRGKAVPSPVYNLTRRPTTSPDPILAKVMITLGANGWQNAAAYHER